ncbi:lasso peptide isopeptide bond-forming cyclase [Paenibacillus harenae]|uniref:asparagine synthase (glutamine-hydrolyzing) n=1 Tax=Paenibacillus harenae TaxID=306543 RepID=A0ABT9U6Z6_PAEHA|nr:lasso peptide isopeptide bond-forming cyclase [Paenibacillus harenae]MDQ0114821.1 asparagine synthase (glutamine-hydrolyzing) [Paenibacillus harenae]
MSAITGIYQYNQEPVVLHEGYQLMSGLEQFAADESHVWHEDSVFFGCHAQWITPESVGECLPYYDSNRRLAITADAIIDNREQLFQLLQVDRDKRTSITDSELILLAYDKWGEDAPGHLAGDFAFMIWDERERILFGARDFSGGRTLYYLRNKGRFAFCTTIMPLLSLPHATATLNEQWLAEFLAISGMIDTVDASSTIYKHIEQVPPSHSITITPDQVSLSRYNTFTNVKPLKLKSSEEYVEAFRDVFREAVAARVRTHRQVGAQLSGGLDSGAVVSFAAETLRNTDKKLHTFSYIPTKDFKDFTSRSMMADESPFIQATVRHVGGITAHYLDFEGKDSFSEVDDFLAAMEMPYKFFENSFWLKGMFEAASNEDAGVLLNGGRGNLSISWGSAIDYYAILLKRFRWIRLTRELHQYSYLAGGPRLRRIPEIARIAFPFIDRLFPVEAGYQLPTLINQEFANRTNIYDKLKEHGMDERGWLSSSSIYEDRKNHFEEVFHWNASNTLSTKLSLRYNVWKRDPTNDIRVIRYCLSVPESQYVSNGLDRALIRRATDKLLPDQIRLNQRIRGVQGADWVHRMLPNWHVFRLELQQLCSDERVMQYFNRDTLEKAMLKIRGDIRPDFVTDPDSKILMRSLIVYRFIKSLL